jgi:glycosyltransferase involved in cell wall biosynthesis
MRIVHLVPHLRLGAGRAVVDLAARQARGRRHDVLVALADDAEGTWRSDATLVQELASAGVPTASIGDFFHRDVAGLARSAERLELLVGPWTNATVVHAHTALGAAVGRWAGAHHTIVTCHGWTLDRAADYTLQDALAFAMADVIVSPSTYWAERVASLPGTSAVRVVPYGFDLSRYPIVRHEQRSSGPLRIVCVGELTRRKGQDVLVEAMPIIWRIAPGTELHMMGDGDLAQTLRARAAQLDPERRRILFHGHVRWPYGELADFDLFCLPTRSDNQPVAIVEAMLAQLPIVATDVGGIREMIAAADCGEIVEPDSVTALAAAVLRCGGRSDRAALGDRGRAFACRTYDVDVCADRVEALYREALGEAR